MANKSPQIKVTLTEKESLFLYHAAWLSEGFLDFENNNDEEFKNRYGFTKEDANKLEVSLRKKLKPINPKYIYEVGKKIWE